MLQCIQVPLLLWEDDEELAGIWRTLLDEVEVEDEPAVPVGVAGDVADCGGGGGSVAILAAIPPTPLWGTLIIPEVTFVVKELLPVLMTTMPPLSRIK